MDSRKFAAPAIVCLGLALSLGGCGGHSRHAKTDTRTLSIYTSLPFEGPDAAEATAIYDAEELALAQAGLVVNGYKVVLRRLDDAGPGGATPALVGQSARTAAADPTAIAYIGELTPGSSGPSIRILSTAGILQVSPGDTATGLAGKTFARVVPPDSDEAEAQLAEMARRGIKSLYLLRDRTAHGRDIAAAAVSDAPGDGIVIADPGGKLLGSNPRALVQAITKSKAGALLYAGSPSAVVAPLWNALSATDGSIRKFGSASITTAPTWAQTSGAARNNTYLTAPGLPSRELPRAGNQFVTDFQAAYGKRVPWTSGIFGYIAMSGVLEAMHGLGAMVRDHAKVAYAFLHTRTLPSALGAYSITSGQSSFRRYFFTTYSRSGQATTFNPGLE